MDKKKRELDGGNESENGAAASKKTRTAVENESAGVETVPREAGGRLHLVDNSVLKHRGDGICNVYI